MLVRDIYRRNGYSGTFTVERASRTHWPSKWLHFKKLILHIFSFVFIPSVCWPTHMYVVLCFFFLVMHQNLNTVNIINTQFFAHRQPSIKLFCWKISNEAKNYHKENFHRCKVLKTIFDIFFCSPSLNYNTKLYEFNKTVKKKNDTHFADAFGNFCVFCKDAFEPMQSLPISLNEYFRRVNVKKQKLQKWKQI